METHNFRQPYGLLDHNPTQGVAGFFENRNLSSDLKATRGGCLLHSLDNP
jgi:hypothetical protein